MRWFHKHLKIQNQSFLAIWQLLVLFYHCPPSNWSISMRQFHRHLKIQNQIIFGHLTVFYPPSPLQIHPSPWCFCYPPSPTPSATFRLYFCPIPPPHPPPPSCPNWSILMRPFHRHLKIQNLIIFGHLTTVLANAQKVKLYFDDNFIHRGRCWPRGKTEL